MLKKDVEKLKNFITKLYWIFWTDDCAQPVFCTIKTNFHTDFGVCSFVSSFFLFGVLCCFFLCIECVSAMCIYGNRISIAHFFGQCQEMMTNNGYIHMPILYMNLPFSTLWLSYTWIDGYYRYSENRLPYAMWNPCVVMIVYLLNGGRVYMEIQKQCPNWIANWQSQQSRERAEVCSIFLHTHTHTHKTYVEWKHFATDINLPNEQVSLLAFHNFLLFQLPTVHIPFRG